MKLTPFDDADLPELMRWFPDEVSCHTWGGTEFRFPFNEATFRQDAKLAGLSTWALVADDGTLAGFGQFYLRVGRCHLGRLAIAPDARGQGLGATLVRELCRQGGARPTSRTCSPSIPTASATRRRARRASARRSTTCAGSWPRARTW